MTKRKDKIDDEIVSLDRRFVEQRNIRKHIQQAKKMSNERSFLVKFDRAKRVICEKK